LADATLNNYNLKLLNVLGKEETFDLLYEEDDILKLNVSHLKKGIYFLQVFDGGKLAQTAKIIKE
jgi:hypothetical protein